MAFFPANENVQTSSLMVTKEGKYSVTKPEHASLIADIIVDTADYHGIARTQIVDATACIGGDTLSFIGKFYRVTAVEINPTNYDALVHNMSMYGHQHGRRLRLFNDNFLDCYERFASKIVYMDAPWGGPEYKKERNLMLYMSGVPVDELTSTVLEAGNAQLVALKVPFNFDIARFKDTLNMCNVPNWVRVHRVSNYQLITVVTRRMSKQRQSSMRSKRERSPSPRW
jgi:predicted RNA methylase